MTKPCDKRLLPKIGCSTWCAYISGFSWVPTREQDERPPEFGRYASSSQTYCTIRKDGLVCWGWWDVQPVTRCRMPAVERSVMESRLEALASETWEVLVFIAFQMKRSNSFLSSIRSPKGHFTAFHPKQLIWNIFSTHFTNPPPLVTGLLSPNGSPLGLCR